MFEQTKSAFENAVKKLKAIIKTLGALGQILYIIYLIFALSTGVGHFVVNVALLILTGVYFIFYLLFFGKKGGKSTYKKLTKIKKFAKLGVKALSLGISIYAFYSSVASPSIFSMLLSVVMIVGWFVKVALEVVLIVASKKARLAVSGFTDNFKKLRQKVHKKEDTEQTQFVKSAEDAELGVTSQVQNDTGKNNKFKTFLKKLKK